MYVPLNMRKLAFVGFAPLNFPWVGPGVIVKERKDRITISVTSDICRIKRTVQC